MTSGVYIRTVPPWNTGLTTETDERLYKTGRKISKALKTSKKARKVQMKAVKAMHRVNTGGHRKYTVTEKTLRALKKFNRIGQEVLRKLRATTDFDKYQRGKNNHNWQGGKSFEPYSAEFNSELKERIRNRDNYQCQNPECNMTEEEHLIVVGKVLTIHHVDYIKENCNENNLITICTSCNSRANFNKDIWKKLYKKVLSEKTSIFCRE